ncbi:DNA cytosine methyltransferase [Pseudomonas chlororaphis]|uniref:DNA cytosine methyltransferase n=1 Tax=Pseudomonas chlororaphis TaxID=587753 RepID=UPI001B310AD4|nr:DNA cytosine methyltransferase [Pseudomonas chlororaphis]QTT81995.1 DNA cytosine methyltransferase [Pseudomonas chlororaphis]
MRFIDVFAGCGGLSLGLLNAGCHGVAAIEKNPMAFETLRHNLIDGKRFKFEWPDWLPRKAMTCEQFMDDYKSRISELAGTIDLMVGGPPCQGFSTAGRRNPADPRNKMAEQYLELVKIIRPNYIVIENVSGFNSRFNEEKKTSAADEKYIKRSYADYISEELSGLGYKVSRGKINCAVFGVPQNRYRYLIICAKEEVKENLFEELIKSACGFKKSKGLDFDRSVTVHDAIADLETTNKKLIPSTDSTMKRFWEIEYKAPDVLSPYLKVMREGCSGVPNSLRLPNHKPDTIVQFVKFRQASEPGKSLSKKARDLLGLKKHAITVLARNYPSPTITTLPDDIIHYSEPRILTARETARIQSFPDWFEFTGKYTTGGKSRKLDCPRYTQIGNAVPPLLSEAIGSMLLARAEQEQILLEPLTAMDS